MDANFWLMKQYRFRDLLDVLSNQRRNHDNNFYLLIAGYRRSTQEDCTRNKKCPTSSFFARASRGLRLGHTSPFFPQKNAFIFRLWPATRSLNDSEGEVWRCRAMNSSPRNYIKNFYKLS